MNLNRTERWILANQYRILAALYPKEGYDRVHIALEHGYAAAIAQLSDHIYPDEDTLSLQECSEVLNIMSTYEALQRSRKALEDPGDIDVDDVRFEGFDGNNEAKYMGYAQYVIEQEHRFTYLDREEGLNSHMPLLGDYRLMVDQWQQLGRRYNLTRDEMLRILHAGGRAR